MQLVHDSGGAAAVTSSLEDILEARLRPGDEQFEVNAGGMLGLLDEVEREQRQMLEGGGERYVARHRERGRLLVRERIELLCDESAPFLELSPLAGWGTQDPLGSGVVTGIAEVAGTQCVIAANDPTVRGGANNPSNGAKLIRAFEIALENRLPLINLVESGGADLRRQAEIFVHGGAKFRMLAEMSAQGIPVLSVVFGPSTAGGAYMPGMSEYTIFVRNQARVYLGGPPLVKMATEEEADEEELGGAEMHARTSGLCDYLAADEPDALRLARRVVAEFDWRRAAVPPAFVEPPRHDPRELLGVPSVDLRIPFDAREILARILDGSRFGEFKPLYGPGLVTGWGRLGGYRLGVLANNGILFSEEARKGAQFIQLCDRRGIPILFIQNITGFMVGTRYEQGGIIKDGAKLINAVSNAQVPRLTLMVGASYGAGNFAMSGRAYRPRFTFTWPNHRIAVMGGKQMGGVLSIIRRNAAQAAGRDFSEEQDALERQSVEEQIDRESHALFATGRVWDDGIIDPRDTRTVLTIALAAVHNAPVESGSRYGVVRH